VANVETLFKSVVYVATGSGIGPVMPHVLARKVPIQLIWSTRDPRATYGDALVDEILRAQPQALIWDTAERGKPDLVQLAYGAVQACGAEAVICIANQALTRHVVQELEARGIATYGAIWDS
jgi:ferredoxin-NADP reductase